MTSEGADVIISKVGGLVSEAIKQIEFKPGSPTTKVVPGFPFTVVGSFAEPITPSADEQVAPWFPPLPYYSQGGEGGSNLFVLPLDPSSTIDGEGCYSSPRPFLFIPKNQERLLYLRQTFSVNSYTGGSYVERQSITPGPASFELFSPEEIPESVYPSPAGGGFLYDPGTYTLYFLIERFQGTDGGQASELRLWGNPTESENAAILAEDLVKNEGAREMVTNGGNGKEVACFSQWAIYSKVFNFGNTSAGDMSGTSGYLAGSYPPP